MIWNFSDTVCSTKLNANSCKVPTQKKKPEKLNRAILIHASIPALVVIGEH